MDQKIEEEAVEGFLRDAPKALPFLLIEIFAVIGVVATIYLVFG